MQPRADATGVGPSPLVDVLFDEAGVARCLVAPDGTVARVNAEWLRAWGRPASELLGKDLAAILPTVGGSVRALALRALAGERVELPLHAAPGAPAAPRRGTLEAVAIEGGTGLLLTSREGSSAAPLTTVVERLRAIADRAPAAVIVKGADGRVLFANRWFEELVGIRRGGATGRTTAELFPAAIAERMEMHERRVAAGHELAGEEEIPTPSGPRTLLAVRFPLPLEDGTIGIVGIAVDVTERRRAEAALRESEERFRLLADAMPQIVCVLGPDGTPEYVNPTWVAFSGLDLAGTARAGWEGIVHPDDVAAARLCRRRALKSLAPQDVELRYRAADGSFRWFVSRLAPVVEGGRVVRLVGAGMEIEGRKRAEQALRDAIGQLQDADRRKDEFLGMLSHELRNPLAPIRNASYILRHAEGTEQARRARAVIERQTEHLTRLVDDLLDVTRIARGKIELRRERLDLREVARRTAEDLRSSFEERGVGLEVSLPADRLDADADATRLSQAVGNLLNNAAKFTRAGDRVTLALRRAGDSAELVVSDTGAGIEGALLAHVFEPFVQGQRTLARTQGGLGLGLALVKGLVELHGGTVSAESPGQGKGTTVTVRLPLAAQPGQAPGPARPRRTAGAGRRVLIVDDNRDAADTLADLVTMLGHDAEVAYDGAAAVAKVRERPPDVVLCDIGLPGMDGFEVARKIRALSGTVRLVAVSGYAQPEDLARAAEAGFERHVAKPPDPAQLEDVLG